MVNLKRCVVKKCIWGFVFSIIMLLAGNCKPIAQETYREMESSSSKTVNLVLMQKDNDLTTLAVCSDKGGCENSLVSKDGSPYHFANTQAVNKAIEKLGTRSKHGRMLATAMGVTLIAASAFLGTTSAYKLIKNRAYTKMTQRVDELKNSIRPFDDIGTTHHIDIGDLGDGVKKSDSVIEAEEAAEVAAEADYKKSLLGIIEELEALPKTRDHAADLKNLKQDINDGNWSAARYQADKISGNLASELTDELEAVATSGLGMATALFLVHLTKKDKQLANRRDEIFSFLTTGKPMSVSATELDLILDSITKVIPAKVNKNIYKHFQQ